MGFFSKLFGVQNASKSSPRDVLSRMAPGESHDPDAQALERYRYMVRTAPPETLEQAHAEAFAKLTPEQRSKILRELAATAPQAERATVAASADDPQTLARIATRAEVRNPGTMERTLGGAGMGLGASLLSSFAMGFVGSMVAQSFFSALGGSGADGASEDTANADEQPEDESNAADDTFGDGGDFGGDFDV